MVSYWRIFVSNLRCWNIYIVYVFPNRLFPEKGNGGVRVRGRARRGVRNIQVGLEREAELESGGGERARWREREREVARGRVRDARRGRGTSVRGGRAKAGWEKGVAGMQLGEGVAARGIGEAALEYHCIYCHDSYQLLSPEDWLHCIECRDWFHKACGSGFNVCDNRNN